MRKMKVVMTMMKMVIVMIMMVLTMMKLTSSPPCLMHMQYCSVW